MKIIILLIGNKYTPILIKDNQSIQMKGFKKFELAEFYAKMLAEMIGVKYKPSD